MQGRYAANVVEWPERRCNRPRRALRAVGEGSAASEQIHTLRISARKCWCPLPHVHLHESTWKTRRRKDYSLKDRLKGRCADNLVVKIDGRAAGRRAETVFECLAVQ